MLRHCYVGVCSARFSIALRSGGIPPPVPPVVRAEGGERGAGTGNCVSGKFFIGCLGPEEE